MSKIQSFKNGRQLKNFAPSSCSQLAYKVFELQKLKMLAQFIFLFIIHRSYFDIYQSLFNIKRKEMPECR